MADEDLDRPRIPMLVYAVIGVLALIGLFSISGMIFGFVFWLVRTLVFVALAVVAFYILKAIVWGRSSTRTKI